jgi:hypothetical protein
MAWVMTVGGAGGLVAGVDPEASALAIAKRRPNNPLRPTDHRYSQPGVVAFPVRTWLLQSAPPLVAEHR